VTTLPAERLSTSITGLVVSSLDSSGRRIGQDALNKRLASAQLLLGHTLGNPHVLSIPAQVSQLDSAGYPRVSRSWIVFAMVECSDGQWLELKSAVGQLRRLWGVGVGLVGPYGYQEV
jgi:hypothetical protein